MVKIRQILIQNFRGISSLEWFPQNGINCLVGPGDSGKTTVLDAIDWCLGARRNLNITDADFHKLDTKNPIWIEIILGDLSDRLLGLEDYGLFFLGYNPLDQTIEEEPDQNLETVLTARLFIEADLEPQWSLKSDRAQAQGVTRFLRWTDRVALAPLRIGAYASYHLTWQRGSVLNRISEEKPDASAALAEAARQAREAFGTLAAGQLEETLKRVSEAAKDLGIKQDGEIKALLDAHSVSFSGGTISLHDEEGVPLKSLGLGSSRLLVSGLQKFLAQESSIALVDELEMGLEPQRIAQFLLGLGAKDPDEPLQIFMTSHSPVVLRELKGSQLQICRSSPTSKEITCPGEDDAIQGTLRSSAEAFLAKKIIVCEGATEVGLVRGLDRYNSGPGKDSFMSTGGATIDAGGVSKIYHVVGAFLDLGYEVAVLRDDDKDPDLGAEGAFEAKGGKVFKWKDSFATEEAIFVAVSDPIVLALINRARELYGDDKVLENLRSAFNGPLELEKWILEVTDEKRVTTAKAAKTGGWFKSISLMEDVAFDFLGPSLDDAEERFVAIINSIFQWGCPPDE